jgi:hypothetical protein
VKASEAPPPGWYPDPEGRSQLRWWEGTDWSDRYRARPTAASLAFQPPPAANHAQPTPQELAARAAGVADSAAWVEQMRSAARGEADRAVQLIDQRLRHARAEFRPLVTEYTSKITRFLKLMAVIAVLLIVAYVVLQVVAQESLFNWLGDRIDNLSNDDASAALFVAG